MVRDKELHGCSGEGEENRHNAGVCEDNKDSREDRGGVGDFEFNRGRKMMSIDYKLLIKKNQRKLNSFRCFFCLF